MKVTADGCLDTLWCQTVAVGEVPQNKAIVQMWPNPADDLLNIEAPNLSEAEIVLYDAQGRAVRREQLTGRAVLSSASLPAGFYFLEIRAGHGPVARRKVVVAH